MKQTDTLFQLIKSLNKSEKRFFKIYSSRHVIGEQNNYVALFDELEKQKKYNETSILTKFEGQKFIKRLGVAKSYLYDLILKSMNVYHAQNGVDAQIMELLRNVTFLFEKNLTDQAYKIVLKAKKLALDFERLSIMPEILKWQKKIMDIQFYEGFELKDIKSIHLESKNIIKKLHNINEYWVLDAKLYYQYNLEGIVRNREDLLKIEDVFNSPLMKNEEKALSFEAKLLLYKIYSTYFFILRDFESCYKNVKKLVQLIESRPELIQSVPLLYINSVNNLLNMTEALNKKEERTHYLEQLQEMMNSKKYSKMERVQVKLFESFYYHQINFFRSENRLAEAQLHINEVDKGLKKYGKNVDKVGKVMLCYHVFQICFSLENFTEAANWLDKILSNDLSDVRHDIYVFSKILNLITHYEMGEREELAPMLKETYHFLNQRESTHKFEHLILDFIRQIITTNSEPEIYTVFSELRSKLLELSKDPFEKKAFAYFDFVGWLNKKIPTAV